MTPHRLILVLAIAAVLVSSVSAGELVDRSTFPPIVRSECLMQPGTVDTIQCFDRSIDFGDTKAKAPEYLWDFGDGTTSSRVNPSHTYEKPGKYSITLTITSSVGKSSQVFPDMVLVQDVPKKSAAKASDKEPEACGITNLWCVTNTITNFLGGVV